MFFFQYKWKTRVFAGAVALTLSWRRSVSYRIQSIDLQNKSMDWFLYGRDLHHELKVTSIKNNFLFYNVSNNFCKEKCSQWNFSFEEKNIFCIQDILIFVFSWIHKLQNLWRHHRYCNCILQGIFFIVSFESYVVTRWNISVIYDEHF